MRLANRGSLSSLESKALEEPIGWVVASLSLSCLTVLTVLAVLDAQKFPVDIDVYLSGASRLLRGTLYTVRTPRSLLWFTYPPDAGLLFIPLTAVSRSVAQVIWAGMNVVLLVLFSAMSLIPDLPAW